MSATKDKTRTDLLDALDARLYALKGAVEGSNEARELDLINALLDFCACSDAKTSRDLIAPELE